MGGSDDKRRLFCGAHLSSKSVATFAFATFLSQGASAQETSPPSATLPANEAPSGPPEASFAPIEEEPAPTSPAPAPVPVQTATPAPTPRPPAAAPQPAPEPAAPAPTVIPSTASVSRLPQSSGPSALPESSSPPPRADDDREAKSKYGLYLDLDVGGTTGIKSTHGWNDNCPEVSDAAHPEFNWSPTCKTTAPLGIVAEGRLGIRFGVAAFEGFGLGAIDWSSAKLGGEEPAVSLPTFASDMQIGRIGGGFGAGLRLMSDGFVRVSAGAGGGFMLRYVFTNVSSLDGSSTSYTAPMAKADLSLTIGNLFNLGLMGWVEFAPTVKVTPNLSAAGGLAGIDLEDPNIPPEVTASIDALENAVGDVTVFHGPQYFVGPYLGLHFGK